MKKVNHFICRCYFLLAIILLSAQIGMAQSAATINGLVKDINGETLIGVNVYVKGTTNGTVTDVNGRFNISVSDATPTLVFSYVGYDNQEVIVNNSEEINIVLQESFMNLEEVFVVGYGVQKKSHLTGAVSKIKSESMAELPVSSIDQALQGKLAGVTIQNTSSEVGTAPQIRIRGMGSISASSEPLVVVDGYPTADGLAMVDLNDVESVEVLKDAASGAIYGSRAANGVILITTKSGGSDKPKYAIKAFGGLKYAYQLHDIMTTDEYIKMRRNEEALGGDVIKPMERAWAYFDTETDWQREGLNVPASIYNAQFSVSGGKKDLTYYISSSYLKDEGIMIDNEYEKFSVRAKMDATLSSKVKVGINISPTYSKSQRPATSFMDFYRTYGWMPVRHNAQTSAITGKAIGEYAHARDFNNTTYPDDEIGEFTVSPWNSGKKNPRSRMDNEKRFRYDYRLQSNAYLSVKINDNLEFKTSNGFYFKYYDIEEFYNMGSEQDGEPNRGVYGNELFLDLLSENILNYNKTFGLHDISALAGFTAQKTTIKTADLEGINFPTDYVQTINAATTVNLDETQTYHEQIGLMSVLGRLTYSYNDKYLMSASIRTDGSSLFGPENRWGVFPAVSLGWRVSEENFMKQLSWVDQFKLRASYGVTGNNDIENYAHINKLNSANYVLGNNNGSLVPGLVNVSSTLANRAITWEQTDEYNFGLDLNTLNSRVNLSAEYYYSVTRKLLFKQPASSFTGFTDYWNNIGKIRNKGVEFELTTYNIKNKQFEWITSFNIAANSNRILEIGGEERFINSTEREQFLARVGDPAIQYFGYKTIGVWNSQEEIDKNPSHISDVPGGLRLADIYKDGVINEKDRIALGNPFPDFTWGLSNQLIYKDFDLSIMIQGVQGVEINNGDGYYNESKRLNPNYVNNRWINAANPGDGKTPYYNFGIEWEKTDYEIEDGSYTALRDVVLGYTLPKGTAKRMGLGGLRFYLSGQNLFFIWSDSYRGINPEARVTTGDYRSPLIDGVQRGSFPIQSTVTGGIEINF